MPYFRISLKRYDILPTSINNFYMPDVNFIGVLKDAVKRLLRWRKFLENRNKSRHGDFFSFGFHNKILRGF